MPDLDVGDDQPALPCLAQDHAEDLDRLATSEQEGHGHACHPGHLDVVDHDHELVHQPLWQVRILRMAGSSCTGAVTERHQQGRNILSSSAGHSASERDGLLMLESMAGAWGKQYAPLVICQLSMMQCTDDSGCSSGRHTFRQYTASRRRDSSVPLWSSVILE